MVSSQWSVLVVSSQWSVSVVSSQWSVPVVLRRQLLLSLPFPPSVAAPGRWAPPQFARPVHLRQVLLGHRTSAPAAPGPWLVPYLTGAPSRAGRTRVAVGQSVPGPEDPELWCLVRLALPLQTALQQRTEAGPFFRAVNGA